MRRERVGGRVPEESRPGLEHLTNAHRQPPPAPEPSGEFKPRERGPGAIEKVGEEAGKGGEECGAVERDRCWLEYGTGLGDILRCCGFILITIVSYLENLK